jgi:hypothetical protein
MTANNTNDLSRWQMFVKQVKRIFKQVQKPLLEFTERHPRITQATQLTIIYTYAIMDLSYTVLNNILSLGYTPGFVRPILPYVHILLQSTFFKFWSSPEKIFFLSFLVIEYLVVRTSVKLSKLVKYNLLLVFALLMIQGLVVSYWDLLFHRQVLTKAAQFVVERGGNVYADKQMAISFFLGTLAFFVILYLYFYFASLAGKFGRIPGLEWLTDSVAFWVRIKTPTMRVGKRRKKKDDETKE